MGKYTPKKVKWGGNLPQEKFPKTGGIKPESGDERLRWGLTMLDREGEWSWEKFDSGIFLKRIHPKIKHYEDKRWVDIIQDAHNHPMPISDLVSQAQTRLHRLKLGDHSHLYQLSCGTKPRVWGVKIGEVFHVLWWDPEHTVYPYEG